MENARDGDCAADKDKALIVDLNDIDKCAATDTACARGNDCFKSKQLALAVKYYSAALQLTPLAVRILSDRAAVYLLLKCLTLALLDRLEALRVEPTHIKCRYRLCCALLALQRPDDAKEPLDNLHFYLSSASLIDCKVITEAKALLVRVRVAQLEKCGEYDMHALVAEYTSNGGMQLSRQHMDYEHTALTVSDVEGKGRGMFTTDTLPALTLVMVAKVSLPIVYVCVRL